MRDPAPPAVSVTGNTVTGELFLVLHMAGEALRFPMTATAALTIADGLREAVAACGPDARATHAGGTSRH